MSVGLRAASAWTVALVCLAGAHAACSSLKQAEGADASSEGAVDGAGEPDGAPGLDAADGAKDSTVDADASADGDAKVGPTGLDPAVVLPDLGEPPCSDPGNPSVCGGVRACRMATPDSGRCDDCNPAGRCGSLVTEPCAGSLDCDVNLQCFRGRCTLFCTLPTGPECGKPNNCVDVGSLQKGLCDPAKLF